MNRRTVTAIDGTAVSASERRGILDHFVGFSLKNPFLALIFAMGLFVGGSWIAATFPVDVFPDLTAPTVTVLTDAHGLAPEDVETAITFPSKQR